MGAFSVFSLPTPHLQLLPSPLLHCTPEGQNWNFPAFTFLIERPRMRYGLRSANWKSIQKATTHWLDTIALLSILNNKSLHSHAGPTTDVIMKHKGQMTSPRPYSLMFEPHFYPGAPWSHMSYKPRRNKNGCSAKGTRPTAFLLGPGMS